MMYQSKNDHSLSVNFISGPLNRLHASAHSLTEAVKRPFLMIALREEENVELKKRLQNSSQMLLIRSSEPFPLLRLTVRY